MASELGKIAGQNLRTLIRESKYRTQEEFAYAYGAEVRTVSRWVNLGVQSLETLESIADFFEVDALSLLANKE